MSELVSDVPTRLKKSLGEDIPLTSRYAVLIDKKGMPCKKETKGTAQQDKKEHSAIEMIHSLLLLLHSFSPWPGSPRVAWCLWCLVLPLLSL